MTMTERTGVRDLTYSRWYRPQSIKRFITARCAAQLMMVDLDAVEACSFCRIPLALIEVKDHRARSLTATVTKTLAFLSGIDAYLVVYTPTDSGDDIAGFAVRDLSREGATRTLSPREYAQWLWSLRVRHYPDCARVARQAS